MNEQMVKILLPHGRSWKIMRGVEVEVPLCAAEVLENARMMESTARSYVDRMAN